MFRNCKISGVGVDSVAYNAAKETQKRGSLQFRVSSSVLKQFNKCPRRWVRGFKEKQTREMAWGSLFDCLVLTPNLFSKRYINHPEQYESKGTKKGEPPVMKPWTRLSKTCREWEEEQEKNGMEVVDENMFAECNAAKSSFLSDEIGRFIAHCENQVFVEGEWFHRESGISIPVQCLIDAVPDKKSEFSSCIADVKSGFSGETGTWGRICLDRQHHTQAAFNLDLFNAATGEERSTFCFLIVENFSPFEPAKKILSQEYLELGRGEVHRMLSNYAVCLANDKWPSYDDLGESAQGWGLIKPPPWAVSQSEYAARFELDEEEAEIMPEELSNPN